MLMLKKLYKDFGNKIILDDIDLVIYAGEKIGMVGDNGTGKSTLLKIITKNMSQDGGEVISDKTFGELKQSSEFDAKELLHDLSEPDFAKEFFIQLKKLGFGNVLDFDNPQMNKLSCGERTKLALATALAKNPSALILDEPTNHLDTEGKNILIQYLNKYNGTILVVSHDKDFLNKTVNKILELKDGKITEYYGNYDDYITQKQITQTNIARTYEEHKSKVEKIKEDVKFYKNIADKSEAKKYVDKAKRAGVKPGAFLTYDARAKKLSKRMSAKISSLEQELEKDVQRLTKSIKSITIYTRKI